MGLDVCPYGPHKVRLLSLLARETDACTVTVCAQCSLRALLAVDPPPRFEESPEAHGARVHPYPNTIGYGYQQLIEAVWTLDDARWQEVERGLREQGERPDVRDEAASALGVLRDFLFSGGGGGRQRKVGICPRSQRQTGTLVEPSPR